MEQPTAPASARKANGKPPLRRGQIRNRIIREFFKSLAALVLPSWANGAGGGAGNNTPTSSTAYNSEGTSE